MKFVFRALLLCAVSTQAHAYIIWTQVGGQTIQSHRPPIIQENPDTAIEGDELAGEPVDENDHRALPNEDLAAPDDALTE